jgi:CBS domain containing-hemolysin-like protein
MTPWILTVGGGVVAGLGVVTAVAASSIGRVELYRWAAGDAPGAGAADRLLEAPDRIVRAAKGIATSGLVLTGLGVAPLVTDLPPLLLGITVVLVVVPLALSLVYAGPRAVGRREADNVVRQIVPTLAQFTPVLSPVAARALAHPAGREDGATVTHREELPALSGVLAFSQRPVREVMTPRTDIVAVREGVTLDALGREFMESAFSRLPVFRDSLDDIIGMIYVFDLLKVAPGAELPVRPVASVPASKRAGETLLELQRDRRQIAVVLDEYGGTAGIVTFEDLLEELVGEIFDEHDDRHAVPADTIRLIEVAGSASVEDIAESFDVQLPGTAETISGLLTRHAGHIPRVGDRYLLAGLEFDVLAATPNRLERILVRRGPVATVPLTWESERL